MTRIPVNAQPTLHQHDPTILERARQRAQQSGKPRVLIVPADPSRPIADTLHAAQSEIGNAEWAREAQNLTGRLANLHADQVRALQRTTPERNR